MVIAVGTLCMSTPTTLFIRKSTCWTRRQGSHANLTVDGITIKFSQFGAFRRSVGGQARRHFSVCTLNIDHVVALRAVRFCAQPIVRASFVTADGFPIDGVLSRSLERGGPRHKRAAEWWNRMPGRRQTKGWPIFSGVENDRTLSITENVEPNKFREAESRGLLCCVQTASLFQARPTSRSKHRASARNSVSCSGAPRAGTICGARLDQLQPEPIALHRRRVDVIRG